VKEAAVQFQTLVDAKSGDRTSRAAQIVQGVSGITFYRGKCYTKAMQELESCFPVAVDCGVPSLVDALCSVTAAHSGAGGEGARTEERSEDELPWSHSISKVLPVPMVVDKWEFRYKGHVVCAKACLAVALAEGHVKGKVTYDKAADHIYTGTRGLRRIGVCVCVCVCACVCACVCVSACVCIMYEHAGMCA
jgi:hypothetical protein